MAVIYKITKLQLFYSINISHYFPYSCDLSSILETIITVSTLQ